MENTARFYQNQLLMKSIRLFFSGYIVKLQARNSLCTR